MQVVTLIDDIDKRTKAEHTVRFALDGEDYEIDLSAKHAKALREGLAPYVAAARAAKATVTPIAKGRPRLRAVDSTVRNAKVRAWAKTQGIKVNDRGRIAATVYARYDAAHAALGAHDVAV